METSVDPFTRSQVEALMLSPEFKNHQKLSKQPHVRPVLSLRERVLGVRDFWWWLCFVLICLWCTNPRTVHVMQQHLGRNTVQAVDRFLAANPADMTGPDQALQSVTKFFSGTVKKGIGMVSDSIFNAFGDYDLQGSINCGFFSLYTADPVYIQKGKTYMLLFGGACDVQNLFGLCLFAPVLWSFFWVCNALEVDDDVAALISLPAIWLVCNCFVALGLWVSVYPSVYFPMLFLLKRQCCLNRAIRVVVPTHFGDDELKKED